jgi:hypothetical protein
MLELMRQSPGATFQTEQKKSGKIIINMPWLSSLLHLTLKMWSIYLVEVGLRAQNAI